LTVQGVCLQPPTRICCSAKLGATTTNKRCFSSGQLPPPVAQPSQRHQQQLLPNAICDDNDHIKDYKIVERPSSRGGLAFEINFNNQNTPKRMPKGLKKGI